MKLHNNRAWQHLMLSCPSSQSTAAQSLKATEQVCKLQPETLTDAGSMAADGSATPLEVTRSYTWFILAWHCKAQQLRHKPYPVFFANIHGRPFGQVRDWRSSHHRCTRHFLWPPWGQEPAHWPRSHTCPASHPWSRSHPTKTC